MVIAASAIAPSFAGRDVLSMRQYTREDLDVLFAAAEDTAALWSSHRLGLPLQGRVLLSAFFDSSTRTRLSHESAMLRLGGSVAGFADASVTRAGGRTQEPIEDVFRMLSLYGDVIIMRHPETHAAARMAEYSDVPVVNAGDGTGEHPTQAMVDLFSISRRLGRLDGLRLLLTHDLRMRCVWSLLRGLVHYDCEVIAVGAPGKGLEPAMKAEFAAAGRRIREHDDLRDVLGMVDAVYSSPTVAGESTPAEGPPMRLDRRLLERHGRAGGPVVFHPLPRKPEELHPDLDETPFNGYWAQAANATFVRMALLQLILRTR
jgi:aspartate carbamoyltransferase catalytic subunit